MKVDVLAIGAHPDDVELCCGGTVISLVREGKKVAAVDLTQGEMGTRGTAETRAAETIESTKILGVCARENIEMPDGFFEINHANLMKVIGIIRKYQPEILLCSAPVERHPDHVRASKLIVEAAFLAGLRKVETQYAGELQVAWRPKQIFHYIQDTYLKPDFITDISHTQDEKIKALLCYKTQFNATDDDEPKTYISTPEFLQSIIARALLFGKRIGVKYGEGFISEKAIGVKSLYDLM